MIENSRVCNEDCMETMSRMSDGFVDLTVTSPPYDNLRTYKNDIDKTWGEHVWKPITEELYRVTKQGGVVVWVAGDATIKGSETGTSFKQALYFKEVGFNLHDTMIWEKPFIVPRPSNRYESSFEFMFIFSVGKPETTNLIKDKQNRTAGRKITGHKRGIDGIPVKLHGASAGKVVAEFGTRHNVWSIDTSRGRKNHCHPASFPEKLAEGHIISWSNEGDLVYDPFMGSGTTGKMAILNNRRFMGSEISEEYCDIANKRIMAAINDKAQQLF